MEAMAVNKTVMRDRTIRNIQQNRIIAVLRTNKTDEARHIMEALYEGGIRIMELPFDQKAPDGWETTAATIRELIDRAGDDMCIGAGTVISPEIVDIAGEAGARFIVSPDTNEAVIRRTLERGLVSIPGAMTPTEILAAHRAGADFVKVFPAGYLGSGYFKSIRKPINHVRLLAFGGIDGKNITEYMSTGISGVGVSGCLFRQEWIDNGEYRKITQAAQLLRVLR